MTLLHYTIMAITKISPGSLPNQHGIGSGELKSILNIVFGIVGALALLMIVISGLKYITSAGNPQEASEARKGVIFALVGLVIALTAQAIVAFVVRNG